MVMYGLVKLHEPTANSSAEELNTTVDAMAKILCHQWGPDAGDTWAASTPGIGLGRHRFFLCLISHPTATSQN